VKRERENIYGTEKLMSQHMYQKPKELKSELSTTPNPPTELQSDRRHKSVDREKPNVRQIKLTYKAKFDVINRSSINNSNRRISQPLTKSYSTVVLPEAQDRPQASNGTRTQQSQSPPSGSLELPYLHTPAVQRPAQQLQSIPEGKPYSVGNKPQLSKASSCKTFQQAVGTPYQKPI
jgi:hypothetical protein